MDPADLTDKAGKAGARLALLASQDAARAAKRRKMLANVPVIDLREDNDEQAVIDLISSRSPTVVLHGPNRLAAGTSGHGSQSPPPTQPTTHNNSRRDASSSDPAGQTQACSLTAQRGALARTRSIGRQKTAPSSDTLRGQNPSGSLVHPTNLHTGPSPNVSPSSLTNPFILSNPFQSRAGPSSGPHQVDSLGQPPSRPGTNKPHQGSALSEPAGGRIDLVKVTEDYSGALQAADKRVQHASTDPALAKALAEKAMLEQQLKEALANKQACHPNQPLRAPMPSHWTEMPQDAHVAYVELPLPAGCSPDPTGPAAQPTVPYLDEQILQAMMQQLPRADAEAALRHCEGDGDEALLYALQCHTQGGAAAVAQRQLAAAAASKPGQRFAQFAAEQARREADLQEALQVLSRVTANGSTIQPVFGKKAKTTVARPCQNVTATTLIAAAGHVATTALTEQVTGSPSAAALRVERFQGKSAQCSHGGCCCCRLSHVVRIERVQNPHLWTKYCLRRHEVELAGSANEQLLFHGCSKDTLAIIGAEGFDIRVSAMSGSLGAGTYFAGNSSYSVGYVDKGPGMTPGTGFAMPGWGGPGMPGFPSGMAWGGPGMPGYPGGMQVGSRGAPGQAPNILPHPSMHGVKKSPNKKKPASGKAKQKVDDSKPNFAPRTKAMFLCRVALGRLAKGHPGMRLPPKGSDAVSCNGGASAKKLGQSIFAVFDNAQAYPEFVIHFKQK